MNPKENSEIARSLEREQMFFRLALENSVNIIFLLDSEERLAYASGMFLSEIGVDDFDLL